ASGRGRGQLRTVPARPATPPRCAGADASLRLAGLRKGYGSERPSQNPLLTAPLGISDEDPGVKRSSKHATGPQRSGARRRRGVGGAVTKKTRNHLDDLGGASRLVIDATRRVTDLVEAMHLTIGGGPAILGRPLERPTRAITGVVYGAIRGVTKLVGASIELPLAQLAPLVPEGDPGSKRETMLAILNGVLGDYLSETGNPLAIEMQLRQGGHPVQPEQRALQSLLPPASGKLLLLVHGSCHNDRKWLRLGHDHGAALARDLGYTPVYLLYNSGL